MRGTTPETPRPRRGSRRAMNLKVALVVVPVLLGGSLLLGQGTESGDPYAPPEGESLLAPSAWEVGLWQETLGGDEGYTTEDQARLQDHTTSELDEDDFDLLGLQATQVTDADLSGDGRGAYATYWADPDGANVTCTDVEVSAANAQRLPVEGDGEWAKTLVVYTATCANYTKDEVQVTHVYSTKGDEGGWRPVREWEVPGSVAMSDQSQSTVPEEWEIKELVACSPGRMSLRIVAADAWRIMCEAAAKEGVTLEATEAYRSPEDQKTLYDDAIKHYGSPEEAQRHVAPSDGTSCSSRHCAGMAVDVKDGPGLDWVHQRIGCSTDGKVTLGASECTGGASPVTQMQRYGFVSTISSNKNHLDSTLPTGTTDDSNSCRPSSQSVAGMVASIFRCRLQNAGVEGASIPGVVAQAVTIARCESGWNPLAISQDGKYTDQPDPRTGRTYTESGVFMLDEERAERWVPGGAETVLEPMANIHGAASIWLTQRNWDTFGCATGQGVGLERGPVTLDVMDLPSWAYEY